MSVLTTEGSGSHHLLTLLHILSRFLYRACYGTYVKGGTGRSPVPGSVGCASGEACCREGQRW